MPVDGSTDLGVAAMFSPGSGFLQLIAVSVELRLTMISRQLSTHRTVNSLGSWRKWRVQEQVPWHESFMEEFVRKEREALQPVQYSDADE